MSAGFEFSETKPHHNCGVAAVALDPESQMSSAHVNKAVMVHLQHRGPEGAGVAVMSPDNPLTTGTSDLGKVLEVLSGSNLSGLIDGEYSVGQVRYPTQGSVGNLGRKALQPFYYAGENATDFWVGHNGDFNIDYGDCASDTDWVGRDIASRLAGDASLTTATVDTLAQLPNSAYSLVMMSRDGVLAMRDPRGFHPLFYGYSEQVKGHIVASETPALRNVGVADPQRVLPGHMLKLRSGEEPDMRPFVIGPTFAKVCLMEAMYFARPDGKLENRDIYPMRREMGRRLAELDKNLEADLVIPVPDSSRAAAQGYAAASGLPCEEGFIKTTSDRSFLQNTQEERKHTADRKLQIIPSQVDGKRIVLVEDSIVRGTTLKDLVYRLKDFGATAVHLRIASPPLMWQCNYGIDIPTREELIAYRNDGDINAIREELQADSLHYLDLSEVRKAVGGKLGQRACATCFTGRKPSGDYIYYDPFAPEAVSLGKQLAVA